MHSSVSPIGKLASGMLSSGSGVVPSMTRRGSSDPDLSVTPKCSSSHSSGSGSAGNKNSYKFMISPETLHMLEYPFITMLHFPTGLVQHLGGVVSARSVKLLDQINSPEDPETRDAWWTELRKEVRSHCRALECNAVLGYSESTYICDEVAILSASGTAALLSIGVNNESETSVSPNQPTVANSNQEGSATRESAGTGTSKKEVNEAIKIPLKIDVGVARDHALGAHYNHQHGVLNCSLCHIPYSEANAPMPNTFSKCAICRKAKVPDVLFMTTEPPEGLPISGIGTLVQVRVCRYKRDTKGEHCAKEISDSLPFLEYELHRQLLTKLKIKGMNALFRLTVQIAVGENMLIALATGTGAYLTPLPGPEPPMISSGKGEGKGLTKLTEVQKKILENMAKNKERFGLSSISLPLHGVHSETSFDYLDGCQRCEMNGTTGYEDEHYHRHQNYEDVVEGMVENDGKRSPGSSSADLNSWVSNKEGCVMLEVDDNEDADIISRILDSDVPKGFEICNTELIPGLSHQYVSNLQTFSRVYRAKIPSNKEFGHQFEMVIQSLFVKLRRQIPCCLADLKFRVDLPEQDIVQMTIMGSAISLFGSCPSGTGSECGGKYNLYQHQHAQVPQHPHYHPFKYLRHNSVGNRPPKKRHSSEGGNQAEELLFTMDEEPVLRSLLGIVNEKVNGATTTSTNKAGGRTNTASNVQHHQLPSCEYNRIELTPLSFVPGAHIHHYLGNLDFFFIRESTSIRENGGLNGFIHRFICEVYAIVRAHVAGLGGNAMIALHLTQCVLFYSQHKNQAQCLINIAGDAVMVHYQNSVLTESSSKNET